MGISGRFRLADQSVRQFLPFTHVGADVDCVFAARRRVKDDIHLAIEIARDPGDAQGGGGGWGCVLADLKGIPEHSAYH